MNWLILLCAALALMNGAAHGATPNPSALDALPGATSVLVQRQGRVLAEHYARGATPETLHDTRSATKSLTALLVAAAVEDGMLRWDEPVFAHFTDQAPWRQDGPAKRGITVADLLTMSSALDCNDWDDGSPGNEENMYPQPNWLRWVLDLPTREVTRDAAGRGPFAYCTAGVVLLGQLVHRVAPGGLEAYQARRLFAPLGITGWEWKRSPSGETMTGGGLRLSTRDLGRFAQVLLQQGQPVLTPASVARTLTVQRDGGRGMGYGHLIWQRRFASRCGTQTGWMMAGNGGNAVVVFPDSGLSVVLTRTHYNQRQMHEQSWAFIEQVLDSHLCAPPPTGG